ncbi:hypothetical protein [Mesorhizobium sp. L103C131B0]|uniref:hypothetical protein n=1 Tax=Mesorhizobium sp. L103C131B0 TaxID=1287089 RepID=UPI0012DE6C36|nr:hypothetical protein [Mesorhizobium sp. L103C131B0]
MAVIDNRRAKGNPGGARGRPSDTARALARKYGLPVAKARELLETFGDNQEAVEREAKALWVGKQALGEPKP